MKKGIDPAAVVRTACALVDRDGSEALTLAQVAAALEIRTPSLYNHVASLADLKRLVAGVAMGELNEALSAAMVGRSGRESLRAGVTAFRAYVLARPGRWQTLCGLPGKEIEADPELGKASEKLMMTLAAGLALYELPPESLVHAVRSLRSLVHGFTALELTGGFGLPVGIDESFEWLVETFLRGLPQGD